MPGSALASALAFLGAPVGPAAPVGPVAGEMEVFREPPVAGRCYKTVMATRNVYIGDGNRRYFTTNVPDYRGRYVQTIHTGGSGDGATYDYKFDLNGQEIRVPLDYAGMLCVIESPCQAGGYRRKTRRLSRRRSKKTRRTHRR